MKPSYVRCLAALLSLLATSPYLACAQGVGIGTTAPAASAALDIVSSSKGVLLPRVADATTIASPATGLVVYQTGSPAGFYYYTGSSWQQLVPANSPGFIRNQTSPQAGASFNVDGSGTVGGTLRAASAVVATALTGSGASVGAAVGVGIRADGGLNLGQNTTGGNIYLGYQAGQANTTGSQNQFSGYQSGQANTTGGNNTFSGYQSGQANTTGSNNTFSGFSSGSSNTTGFSNVFSGYASGSGNTTGNDNVFAGTNSGRTNTGGSNNVFTGSNSGFSNTTGNGNVFSGYQSGQYNTTGSSNVFSGYQSGQANTTGNNNTFSGYQSGSGNTTGFSNVFSGYASGADNTTGNDNVFVGTNSGRANTTGGGNVFTGSNSGSGNTTGFSNVFSGSQSGSGNTTGNDNLFDGVSSGHTNTSGSNNTFTGSNSGASNTTGNSNVFSGYQSGQYNTTGSSNTALGYNSGPASGSGALANATALGANVSLTQSNTVILGNAASVGIGTSTPGQLLELAGQAAPTLLLHASGNNAVAGATLQFRESSTAYGWNLRHNTGGSEGGSTNDRLVLESVNGAAPTPTMTWDQGTNNVGVGTAVPATRLDVNGNLRLAVRLCPVNQATYTLTAADLAFSIFKVQDGAFANTLMLPSASAGQVEGQELTIVSAAGTASSVSGTNTDNTAAVTLAGAGGAGVHALKYVWTINASSNSYWIRVQ